MLAFAIILASCLFVFKNQRYLLLIFSFTASTSDSLVITELLTHQFSLFPRVMEMLLFVAAFIGVWQNRKILEKLQRKYIQLSMIFIACFAVIAVIKYGMELNMLDIVARIINFSVQYGPTIFILLLSTLHSFDFKRYLYLFLGSHILLAILVMYGPYVNFYYFEFFKYAYWHLNDFSSVPNISEPVLIRGDVLKTLGNKYLYFVDSCFHNANILGFYAGSFAFIFLLDYLNSKRKLFSIILFIVGIILWIDAGTKAPMIAILVVIFTSYYKSLKKNMLLAILILVLFPISIYAVYYAYNNIFVDSINISLESRQELIVEEFDFLLKHFFLGQTLKENISSPHQLFLLYGTSCGIIVMLLSLWLMYIRPFVDTINHYSVSALGIYLLLFFMSITDNFTAISLYMLLFSYLLYECMNNIKSNKIKNGTIGA